MKSKLSRRNFLLALGAGSAAAAVASKVGQPVKAPSVGKDKRRGKGYQETAHVRNYYRTAKV
ncbi:MAG: twin-arginine translocation signal domain-containing protein [Betaproteobacteria bacterium]|nr:twin-arginine translocation signal domain-containing protein [Betaproteobacteria bacterium]